MCAAGVGKIVYMLSNVSTNNCYDNIIAEAAHALIMHVVYKYTSI